MAVVKFFFLVEFTSCLVGVKMRENKMKLMEFSIWAHHFFPTQIGDKKGEKMLMIMKVQNCP